MKRSQKQPDLTIVIPALNEEKRIGKTLDEVAEFLLDSPEFKTKDVELLVVAADPKDRTHEIVLEKQKKFKNLTLLKPGPKVGKGRDVQYGILRANGKAVLFMDADLATPLHHLKNLYRKYEKGAEVVVATRNLRKHHKSLFRRTIANSGNLLFRVAGGVWVEDSQCGFKLFSARAADICFTRLTIKQWGFDMEVLAIAKANKLKIASHRVNDWKDMPDSTFEDSMIANSLHSLKDLGHIARHRISGKYRKTQHHPSK